MKSLTEASARLTAPAYLTDLLNKNVYSSLSTKISIKKIIITKINIAGLRKRARTNIRSNFILLCGRTKKLIFTA